MSREFGLAKTVLVLVFAGLLGGCAAEPKSGAAEPRDQIRYARVAVVGFENRTPYGDAVDRFTAALRRKLAERTADTDVVIVPRAVLGFSRDPFMSGRIPVDALVRLRKDYLADAVVVGAVESFRPYRPPSVHLSLKVVDTGRGDVAFELSDGWDAATRRVQDEIARYYDRNRGADDCRFGPDIFLISPRHYLSFIADRVARRLSSGLNGAS